MTNDDGGVCMPTNHDTGAPPAKRHDKLVAPGLVIKLKTLHNSH